MNEPDELLLSFYSLYDIDRGCYLVGARVRKSREPTKFLKRPFYAGVLNDGRLVFSGGCIDAFNNRNVVVSFYNASENKDLVIVPFVAVGNCYYTEKPFQIPVADVENSANTLLAFLFMEGRLCSRRDLTDLITNE